MGGDIIDVLRCDRSVGQRRTHGVGCAAPVFQRLSDVGGVGGCPVASHLGQDPRPAFPGMFQFFKHTDARAFAQHEAVAGGIERTRGLFRRNIA